MVVDFPLGHTAGPPDDEATQRSILLEALTAATKMDGPGSVVQLNYRWIDDDWKSDPLSWRRRRQSSSSGSSSHSVARHSVAQPSQDQSADTRTPRSTRPSYQNPLDEAEALRRDTADQCLVCIGWDPTGPS